MLGKNQGKTHVNRKRKLRPKGPLETKSRPKMTEDSSAQFSASAASPICGSSREKELELVRPSASSTVAPYFVLPVPRKFGSDLSTFCFPDRVDPTTVEVVLRCKLFTPVKLCCVSVGVTVLCLCWRNSPGTKLVSSIAKQVLFPLESCIFFDRRAEMWIAPLTFDSAFLHAMIFSAQFYFDVVSTGISSSLSQRALPHFAKTISLLHERMTHDDDEQRLSNSTVVAIMVLVMHAHVSGDIKSARHHMQGLCKIIALRGGVASFAGSAKLLMEIFR